MKNPKSQKLSLRSTKPWEKRGDGVLRIRWTALLAWLLVIGLTTWLATASALFWFIKQSGGYTEVRFSHVVGLPFTLKAYRQAKGEFFLEQGLLAAKENRWRDAFDLLQLGLPAQPNNEEARMTLARIYLMARRPDQAKTVFLEGLDYRSDNPSAYVRTVLSFLFEQQADDTVVEIADSLLARGEDLPAEIRSTLVAAKVYANFNRDRFDEARKSFTGTRLENSPQARFIEIRITWERGLRESALISLRDLHARYPEDDEVYRTLEFYLREQGSFDEARRLALARQLAFPEKAEPYLDFIRLCAEESFESRRKAAVDDYLRLFGTDTSALFRLQTLAAQFGWSDLAWRIVSLVPSDKPREQGAATALAIESLLTAKQFEEAGRRAAEQLGKEMALTEGERMIFTGLEGLAYFGRGVEAEGRARINRVLSSGVVASTTLASLGRHLLSMGKTDVAEALFARAVDVDALNTSALVALLQLKLESRKLEDSLDLVERLPLVRKPSLQLMQDILGTLRSDRYLYVAGREPAIRSLESRVRLIEQR